MALRVRMTPHVSSFDGAGSGIRTVVEKYFKHLPQFDIELVEPNATTFDLWAIHAGVTNAYAPNDPIVALTHGLYFSADYRVDQWELQANREVIDVIRHAQRVTAPSRWVAEAYTRDLHFLPEVIPHGVDWEEWQGGEDRGYVLWGKNRNTDVCNPEAVNQLAARIPDVRFLTTFADPRPTANVKVTGPVSYEHMREMILGSSLFLSTNKETFGLSVLQSLAAGVPVLGYDFGGNSDLVQHTVTGYLAEPGNIEDLAEGLRYCLQYRKALGRNAKEAAKAYSWEIACAMVAEVFNDAVRAYCVEMDTPLRIDPALYNITREA